MIFSVLIGLALTVGSVLGWVAFFRVNALRLQDDSLKKQLSVIAQRQNGPIPVDNTSTPTISKDDAPTDTEYETESAAILRSDSTKIDERWREPHELGRSSRINSSAGGPDRSQSADKRSFSAGAGVDLFNKVRQNWMTWLGGLSIALGGIFMVRYSIEQGYLGPTARIILALATGVLLHGAAEWLRRHNVGNYQAFAALAGGASITLYAALLAALHLYQLIPPFIVFALLAIVSLFTMVLAIVHGPLLAAIGILGAYVVPLLVDTGSGSILGLLAYSLIISAAAMALMHFIYRYWIWAGMLTGAMGWWFLSLLVADAEGFRGYYLAALTYLIIAAPLRDWLLSKAESPATSKKSAKIKGGDNVANAPMRNSLLLIVTAFGLSILGESSTDNAVFLWTPLLIALFLGSRNRYSLRWLPWISLGVQCIAWTMMGLGVNDGSLQLTGLHGADQTGFLTYALWAAVLYVGLSIWNLLKAENRTVWISLALVSPLAWLALNYLLVPGIAQSENWAALAMVIGLGYFISAAWLVKTGITEGRKDFLVWLILTGHFAYSLAVAILFRQAGLTLALSAELVTLAWAVKTFDLPKLSLLLKVVLAVVVVRLTTNPWLLTYPWDVHWSLWSYGGATVFSAMAAWQLPRMSPLRKWLEMATLHLLVLTVWAEMRYWIYDGDIFTRELGLLETAINAALWSSLGLVYYLRSGVSQSLEAVYIWASRILVALALGAYLMMLLPLNPLFKFPHDAVATTPIVNLLLLAYGLPAVIGMLFLRYYDSRGKKLAAAFVGFSAFVFINMEIRHLWQNGVMDFSMQAGNGELYTYSVVWLVLAVVSLLAGSVRFGTAVYWTGLSLLLIVIGKIFLVDMADLEGLLRVASFMGLGLSLLGLAYLYQRFNLTPSSGQQSGGSAKSVKPG